MKNPKLKNKKKDAPFTKVSFAFSSITGLTRMVVDRANRDTRVWKMVEFDFPMPLNARAMRDALTAAIKKLEKAVP